MYHGIMEKSLLKQHYSDTRAPSIESPTQLNYIVLYPLHFLIQQNPDLQLVIANPD